MLPSDPTRLIRAVLNDFLDGDEELFLARTDPKRRILRFDEKPREYPFF